MKPSVRAVALVVPAALAAILVGACTTTSSTISPVEHGLEAPRTFRVAACTDSTANTTRDLGHELTEALTSRLKEVPSVALQPDGRYELSCRVEVFEEGSALKRWVASGWGKTDARIAVMVIDSRTGSTVTVVRAESVLSAGGLYTIGADQRILKSAVDDAVMKLTQIASGEPALPKPAESIGINIDTEEVAAKMPIVSAEKAGAMEKIDAVVGNSCKKYLWDSDATAEAATLQAKVKAAQLNASAITDLFCSRDGFSLSNDCWQSYTCTATALR